MTVMVLILGYKVLSNVFFIKHCPAGTVNDDWVYYPSSGSKSIILL